ncbi:molybdenum cofactor guanylyltransferase [Pseudalkalibacillus sp. SCS-8]|uniref:molybdenum cofactor guanylyltransferase n=1 Tax=Pseudalkalibacillus nanhaiensis TaxID=3115291 RepID=UPI0032DB3CF0
MTARNIGIVLAGGESRRYGSPKALEKMDGEFFYEKAINVLRPLVDKIVIVAHPSIIEHVSPSATNVTVITDVESYQGMGPLAGIYSGMKAETAEEYYVLACDMPKMDTAIYQQLAAVKRLLPTDCSVIPTVDGRFQPLAALYSSAVLDLIPSLLEKKKRRLTDLIQQTDCAFINYTSKHHKQSFSNVNTPEDFSGLKTREN